MEQPTYDNKIQEAVAQAEIAETSDVVELSSGVKLKTKRVNVLRIQAIVNQFKYPPIPETWDKEKGRSYKNPHLPEYLEQRQEVDVERTLAVVDAVAALGTELYYKPESIPAIEDQSWLDELDAIGIQVKVDNPTARYLAWVKYVAIVDQEDLARIAQQAGITMGISEGRVAASLQGSFQDN